MNSAEGRGESVPAPNSWQQDQTSEEISLPSDYISVDGMRLAEQNMTEPVSKLFHYHPIFLSTPISFIIIVLQRV